MAQCQTPLAVQKPLSHGPVGSGAGPGQPKSRVQARIGEAGAPRDARERCLGTEQDMLLVALAGGADTMAAVAEFTVDHQAWFRLGCPWARPCRPTIPTACSCVGWSPKRP